MTPIFNKEQRKSLANLSFKVAELLLAGVVIAGFMQPTVPVGKMVFALAVVPIPVIAGLVLQSGDDP